MTLTRRHGFLTYWTHHNLQAMVAKMSKKRLLIAIWILALVIRFTLLFFLHDTYYMSGMASGDLAYGIVSGQGLVFRSIPEYGKCTIYTIQNHYQKLIDIEDYLKNYEILCGEMGLEPKVEHHHPIPLIHFRMPGAGILLAGTYYIFGEHRYIYLQVIQVIVDSLGVFLIFWIAKQYFNRRIALLSALLYAVFIPSARLAIVGGICDAWMPILLLTALYCFLRAINTSKKPWFWFAMAGTTIGVATYFRPTVLLLPFAWAFLLLITKKMGLAQVGKTLITVLVPVIMLLLPWWIRNYVAFERFIPTQSGLWMAWWQGFGEFENPFGVVTNDALTYQQYQNEGGTLAYFSFEYADDHFRPKVIRAIINEPIWYLSIIAYRLLKIPVQFYDCGKPGIELPLLLRRMFNGITLLLFVFAAAGIRLSRKNLPDCILRSSPIFS